MCISLIFVDYISKLENKGHLLKEAITWQWKNKWVGFKYQISCLSVPLHDIWYLNLTHLFFHCQIMASLMNVLYVLVLKNKVRLTNIHLIFRMTGWVESNNDHYSIPTNDSNTHLWQLHQISAYSTVEKWAEQYRAALAMWR